MVDRISNLMTSRLSLGNISRTNRALFETQQQVSTGKAIQRPSDHIVKAATIAALNDRLQRAEQLTRNLNHADSALAGVETTLNEANQVALQAKGIASTQINATSSATERAGQASVVDGLLRGLFNIANTTGVAGYVMGGSQGASQPVESFLGGYRYLSTGNGVVTDLDSATAVPLTLGGSNPVIRNQAATRTPVNLDPHLTSDTRLSDLRGARGLGVTLGVITFQVDGGDTQRIDLAGSDTAEDVRARIENSLRAYEQETGTTVLGSNGVTIGDDGFVFDLAGTGGTPALEFAEIGTGVTARDLGLASTPAAALTPTSNQGAGVGPRLTWRTPVNAMGALLGGGSLSTLRISNAGKSAIVDLSDAQTLQDIRNKIHASNLGVRVEISPEGDGISVTNEVSSGSANSLSISEVGGGDTATRLGIRTFNAQTRIADMNFGKGVGIVHGVINPSSTVEDPELNKDFEIRLGDTAGTVISIDLRPEDMVTVQTVLDRINSQAAEQLTAAGLPTTSLTAGLAGDGNGLTLSQSSTFTNPLTVTARNNSSAAEHLGLSGATYDSANAQLIGQDRAKVRVDSMFSDLIDLREALMQNNISGISFAGEKLESTIGHVAELRGIVGGHAQRVEAALSRASEQTLVDTTIRSELQDVDFAQAASRFSLLQVQLEAGLRTTALAGQRTLLDFLG